MPNVSTILMERIVDLLNRINKNHNSSEVLDPHDEYMPIVTNGLRYRGKNIGNDDNVSYCIPYRKLKYE